MIALKSATAIRCASRRGARRAAPLNERAIVRFNGKPSLSAGHHQQATANPLDLSAGVREVMPRDPAATCRRA